MMTWQEEVLLADAKWTIARVSRRAGKTLTAINWAVAVAGQQVLYVVPYSNQKDLVRKTIESQYSSMIVMSRENTIALSNSTTIRIISATDIDTCGLKASRIVIDEAGYIKAEVLDALMPCIGDTKSGRVLLVTSTYQKGSIMEKVTNNRPSSALYVSYDYVDMLRDKEITPAQVFELQSQMSKATFAEEFGPYTTFDIDNQLMEHVLRNMNEYV